MPHLAVRHRRLAGRLRLVLGTDALFQALVVQRSRAYVRRSLEAAGDGDILFPKPREPKVQPYSVKQTYGKLLFEYGLLGAIGFSTLIFAAINRSAAPIRIRVILVVQWFLLGGNLLAPESLLLIFFMSGMWPARVAADALAGPHGTGPHGTTRLQIP